MIVEASRTINLGKQGDNDYTVVKFDVSGWSAYGDGIFSLNHKRSIDCSAYPCVVSYENGFVYWTIKATDTQFAGNGLAQLVYSNEDGVIIHTEIYNTFVAKSLVTTDTPPEPFRPWVDRITGMIETETAQRMADDEELANAIDEEAGTRAANDTTLNDKIEAEAQQRAEEDAELWEAIETAGSVQDVQIDGTSILVDGVANIPPATIDNYGLVKTSNWYGIILDSIGSLEPRILTVQQYPSATNSFFISKGTLNNVLSTPSIMPTLTDAEKAAARERIGIEQLELIADVTVENSEVSDFYTTKDSNGNNISLKRAVIYAFIESSDEKICDSMYMIVNNNTYAVFAGSPCIVKFDFNIENKIYTSAYRGSGDRTNTTEYFNFYRDSTQIGSVITKVGIHSDGAVGSRIKVGTRMLIYGVRS